MLWSLSSMLAAAGAVLTALLAVLTAKRWQRANGFWAQRGVPSHPPKGPHPVWGSLDQLYQINLGFWMRDLYAKYRETSPYLGIWLFWRPALVINCSELARNILLRDVDNFRDHFLGSSPRSDPTGGLNVFMLKDPQWTTVRRKLTPVFTSAKLRALEPLLKQRQLDLQQRITNNLAAKESLELRSLFSDFATDVIGAVAFDLQGDATLTGESALRRVTHDFAHFTLWRGLSWTSIFFLPELVDVFRFSMFPRRTTRYFQSLFNAMVQKRLAEGDSARGDLVDILLRMRQDELQKGNKSPDDLMLAQSVIFVQGGFDTSASASSFAVYELAHQPDLQDKLYEELKETRDRLGQESFDLNTLSSLTYLNCVLKEAMRMYPPMGWLDRVCARDYPVDEKLTLPAGTPVYVNAIGMHYDERYFPEPTRFDPDRFLPENEAAIPPYTYMPFGEGPRACIGKRLGLVTARAILASLFLRFSVRPVPGGAPLPVPADKRGMFLMPGAPLRVQFIPRPAH